MNKIDDILERLQSAEQPVVECPDELTERIMSEIWFRREDSPPAPPLREGSGMGTADELPLSKSNCNRSLPLGRAGGESAGERAWALPLIRTVLSIAALWLVGFFIYSTSETIAQRPRKQQDLPYYTYSISSGSTLKDVYTSRQRKGKSTISYTQFRSKLYENK